MNYGVVADFALGLQNISSVFFRVKGCFQHSISIRIILGSK